MKSLKFSIQFYLLFIQTDNKESGLWLSGTCQGKNREFYWFGHDEQMTYTDWRINQPNNRFGSEKCIAHYQYSAGPKWWGDESCLKNQYFICEYF